VPSEHESRAIFTIEWNADESQFHRVAAQLREFISLEREAGRVQRQHTSGITATAATHASAATHAPRNTLSLPNQSQPIMMGDRERQRLQQEHHARDTARNQVIAAQHADRVAQTEAERRIPRTSPATDVPPKAAPQPITPATVPPALHPRETTLPPAPSRPRPTPAAPSHPHAGEHTPASAAPPTPKETPAPPRPTPTGKPPAPTSSFTAEHDDATHEQHREAREARGDAVQHGEKRDPHEHSPLPKHAEHGERRHAEAPPEEPSPTVHAAEGSRGVVEPGGKHIFSDIVRPGTTAGDEEWEHYGHAIAARHEEHLRTGGQLNQTERKILRDTEDISRLVTTHKQHQERHGTLARVTNAIGWAPLVPPEIYMAQMALGEMGAGLSLGAVAGGMGIAGAIMAGAAVGDTVASQRREEQMLGGLSNRTTPRQQRPMDQSYAHDLSQMGYRYGMTPEETFKLLPAVANEGIGDRATTQEVIRTGLTQAAFSQLPAEQTVGLQAKLVTTLGVSAQQASREVERLNQRIEQLGAQPNDVIRSLDAAQKAGMIHEGTDITQFAGVSKALQGTGVTTTQALAGTETTALPRLVQAADAGMSEQDYMELQKRPEDFAAYKQKRFQRALDEANGSVSVAEANLQDIGLLPAGPGQDEVFDAVRKGAFVGPPLAGPWHAPMADTTPQTPEELDASMRQRARQAELDRQAGLGPWDTLVQGGGQILGAVGRVAGVMGGVVDASSQAISGAGLLQQGAGEGGGIVGAAFNALGTAINGTSSTTEHVVRIVVEDPNGKVLSTTQQTLTGNTTQTPTTTPGAGPPDNVATTAPATPTTTNLNGRTHGTSDGR